MIDVTDIDKRTLIKEAYSLSVPQGRGLLHYDSAPLTDEEADEILEAQTRDGLIFSMDYVKGRAVKMACLVCFIRDDWATRP